MSAAASVFVDKQHITCTPGVCEGKPCIAGTRIRVWDIGELTDLGLSASEIVSRHSRLTFADVHAALAYYHDHREQIDREIDEDRQYVAELRQRQGPGYLDEMRARGELDGEVPPG